MSTTTTDTTAETSAADALDKAEAAAAAAQKRVSAARRAKEQAEAAAAARYATARDAFEADRAAAFEAEYLGPLQELQEQFTQAVTQGSEDPVAAWLRLRTAATVASAEYKRFTEWQHERHTQHVERLRKELDQFNARFDQIGRYFGRRQDVAARSAGQIVGVDHGQGSMDEYAKAVAEVNAQVQEWADTNGIDLETDPTNEAGYRPESVVEVTSRYYGHGHPLIRPILKGGFAEAVDAAVRTSATSAADKHNQAVEAEIARLNG